jgi:hypothetical protein
VAPAERSHRVKLCQESLDIPGSEHDADVKPQSGNTGESCWACTAIESPSCVLSLDVSSSNNLYGTSIQNVKKLPPTLSHAGNDV